MTARIPRVIEMVSPLTCPKADSTLPSRSIMLVTPYKVSIKNRCDVLSSRRQPYKVKIQIRNIKHAKRRHRSRCIKSAFERKSEKSNATCFFKQSESRIKDLRLICLICVQTQFLCNGAIINYSVWIAYDAMIQAHRSQLQESITHFTRVE